MGVLVTLLGILFAFDQFGGLCRPIWSPGFMSGGADHCQVVSFAASGSMTLSS